MIEGCFFFFFSQAQANHSDASGTDPSGVESCQSLPSSSPDSTGATQASQSHHTMGQSHRPCTHERRQQGDFKRGHRGRGGRRGGLGRHAMPLPGVERLGGLMQCDKITCVPSNTTSQVESTAQGQVYELRDNTAQLRQPLTNEEEKSIPQDKVTSKSNCGQDMSKQKECISKDVTPTILQDGHPEREHASRGWKRGSRGSGRHYGHWQDRNFKGPGYWDNSGSVGHRGGGHRAREGGAATHHRGGGAHRGGGRGLHQRVEKEFRKEGVL